MLKIKKIKKSVLLTIFSVLLTVIAGTAAWLTWRSNNTALVLTFGDINNVQVTLKPYAVNATILPVNSYNNEEYTNVDIDNNSASPKKVKLFYRINQIDEELISSDFKYTITKSTDSGTTYTEYITGDLSEASSNTDLYIMDEEIAANDNTKYKVYIWLDGSNGGQTGVQGKSFVGELRGEIIDQTTTSDTLIAKSNPSTLSYNDATVEQKGEMWTFEHAATTQVPATTDYRYIGNTPNNYITFNNETWRIIGVFDGKIKIIRDTSIGALLWDYKQNGVGSSTNDYGSNDWSDSQLMYMLNPTTYTLKSGYTLDGNYIKDGSNNIIYQLGCKPASIAAGATSYSCTNNTWSLNEPVLSQIATTTYYLGGTANLSGSANDIYNLERGTTVSSGRLTSWTGQVALMYPSDYAYTFANGVDNLCYTDPSICETSTPSSSWLYKPGALQWLLTTITDYGIYAFFVYNEGSISIYDVSETSEVFPVVYLKPNVVLQGVGTSSDPYTIIDNSSDIPSSVPENIEISSTSNQKATSQTATLSCSDPDNVVGYYYGTSAPTSSSTYTTVTSTTNFSTTKTINSAGTYYFACKDSLDNVSITASKTYHKYTVKNMLQNLTGSTYTTIDYTQASSYDYIAPSGTSLTITNIYTIPTGSSAGRISYYSVGAPSTTGATTIAKATNPTLSANNTIYAMWFPRNLIYIKHKPNGGTVRETTQTANGATTYTWGIDSNGYITRASNGGTATNNFYSRRYGETSLDLAYYANANYLYITRTGYSVPTNQEWMCESDCTPANKIFSQAAITLSSSNEMCNASTSDCTIVLKVNWVDNIAPTASLTVSQNGDNVVANLTASDAGSGIKLPYYYKISTSSTCDSSTTGFTSSNNTNYTFMNPPSGTNYVCAKVVDNDGNTKYVSKSIDLGMTYEFLSNNYQCNTTATNLALNYTGNCTLIDDGNGDWQIKFLTSGKLTINRNATIDVFLVGGGGGGYSGYYACGGAGGYTTTEMGVIIQPSVEYTITIGTGGAVAGTGGTSIFKNPDSSINITAMGGTGGGNKTAGSGGSGGASYGSGGLGGTDGSNGIGTYIGQGQGFTTRAFGDENGTLYAGGGGGQDNTNGGAGDSTAGKGGYSGNSNRGSAGVTNTGGGGGGGVSGAGTGGSGIVIIRNTKNKIIANNTQIGTYTGTFKVINDGNGNWRVKFLTNGVFVPSTNASIDVFLVGGGGGGAQNAANSSSGYYLSGANGGGGGGYTKNSSISPVINNSYPITIGTGGTGGTSTIDGGNTTAFGFTAGGGKGGTYQYESYHDSDYMYLGGGSGGDGGSGGGTGRAASVTMRAGGVNGADGDYSGGKGQITQAGPNGETGNTREFGEASGDLYSTGGNAGGNLINGTANTGNGGSNGGSGGSGIVVIRNRRT